MKLIFEFSSFKKLNIFGITLHIQRISTVLWNFGAHTCPHLDYIVKSVSYVNWGQKTILDKTSPLLKLETDQLLLKYMDYVGEKWIPERKPGYNFGEENRCWGLINNFHCNLPDAWVMPSTILDSNIVTTKHILVFPMYISLPKKHFIPFIQ